VPLHEQGSHYTPDWNEVKKEVYDRETKYPLITWVFEEGPFVPAAKLTEKQNSPVRKEIRKLVSHSQKIKNMSLIEKDSLYYYLIGIDCLNKGNLEDALANFDESLMIEEHFKTYQKKAEILEKKGLYKESYNALEKAYDLNPYNDNVATSFAKILQKKRGF
jgi:tetratricopeptide (TPR) repeat protein